MRPLAGRRRAVQRLIGLMVVGATGPALAGLVESIQRVKQSLVAVGTFQRTRNPAFKPSGTGFVVGDGSLIVTNAHVVSEVLETSQFEVRAMATTERGSASVRELSLLASDPLHDLAVLKISGGAAMTPLRLATAPVVKEGQAVAIAGFPLVNLLGVYPVTHSGTVAALAPIVIPAERARQLDPRQIRQLANDPFEIIQLDITAYPGNSGSPLFDPETGEVIGVVNSVFIKGSRESALSTPSGITYAIPVRYVHELLRGTR